MELLINISEIAIITGDNKFKSKREYLIDFWKKNFKSDFEKYKKLTEFVKETDVTINEGTLNSSSFLGGIGYGTRDVGKMNFFTLILVDFRKDLYSPYRTYGGGISPIIRSGLNFYFGRKKK